MKQAIGYIRVSTDRQAEEGFGMDAQRDQIESYAKQNGYEVIKWLRDEGVSGASDDRPAFDQIVYGDITNPPFQFVLVARSDRVARDINLYFFYKHMLTKKDIKLISVNEDFGQFGVFAPVLEAFTQTMAEMEREAIKKRTMGGRKIKARAGGFAGGPAPMGYSISGGSLVINEDEAKVVREIFRLRGLGLSLREISDRLEMTGFKSRTGVKFAPTTLTGIMNKRPLYMGYYKFGEMEDWVEGQHEAILNNEGKTKYDD